MKEKNVPPAITVTAHIRIDDTIVRLAGEVLQVLGSHKASMSSSSSTNPQMVPPVNQMRNGYSDNFLADRHIHASRS